MSDSGRPDARRHLIAACKNTAIQDRVAMTPVKVERGVIHDHQIRSDAGT
ncbi:MAG: hypothetical protein JXQ99_16115 [Hyphomicrobiaceae bacterium]